MIARRVLNGGYPTANIDWGKGLWKILPLAGKFGTFHVTLADREARKGEFHFLSPRIFVGVDVYNDGPSEETITVRAPDQNAQNRYVAKRRTSARQDGLEYSFIARGI